MRITCSLADVCGSLSKYYGNGYDVLSDYVDCGQHSVSDLLLVCYEGIKEKRGVVEKKENVAQ